MHSKLITPPPPPTLGANLYTWGLYASGTGFQTASNVPRRLEEFNGNVAKVSAGSEHTAVLTSKQTRKRGRKGKGDVMK